MPKRKNQKKAKNPTAKYSLALYLGIVFFVFIAAYALRNMITKSDLLEKNKAEQAIQTILDKLKINSNNMKEDSQEIRQPAVSGGFYPSEEKELKQVLGEYLGKAEKTVETGEPKALIVPHAGYIFSGQIAAYGYKYLEEAKNINKVFVLGPSHYVGLEGVGISSAEYFKTPLGKIKLSKINKELSDKDNFKVNDDAHLQEHSIEVQLPFLQTVIKNDFELIPLVVGDIDKDQAKEIAKSLNQYIDENTLIVISSDLSHYHPYDEAVKLDNKTIDDILNNNLKDDDELCGIYPEMILSEIALLNNWSGQLIKYANSGDVIIDKKDQVVGYASFVFSEKPKEAYTDEEKKFLLETSRKAIEQYLIDGKEMEIKSDNPKFLEKKGVFVTLTINNELRGCIGYIEAIEGLLEAVVANSISAGFNDYRFTPLTKDELAKIKIEISILTNPEKTTFEEIKPGIDGVILQKGMNQATYLPQVWEEILDKEKFMQSLCEKAGLNSECYKDKDTEFSKYQVIKFSD